MVNISNSNLEDLAQKHYSAIENYFLNKNRGFTIIEIDNWIVNCFSSKWNLKKIILAKPKDLEKLIKIYKWKCCNNFQFFKTLYGYINQYGKRRYFLEENAQQIDYNAHLFIKNLGINICPYCNRNTIYNLNSSKERTSELDHFYPKSKYPFLAISFYNLVPSCKVCNKIKLDKDDKEYINPYDDRFNMNKNSKFTMIIKDATFFYDVRGFSIGRKFISSISSEERKRINNNIEDFKLYDLYQNHKDIVLELIQKREIYPDSYIDELASQYAGMFKNREDILRLITCGYVEDKDLHKRPLSKLIKDISEELELL